MPHTSFDRRYVWGACIMALGSGFAIAGHLSFILGFSFTPGPGFVSFVQTHGHVQLVGWAGLLIMGISLHVLPRLAGAPLAHPQWRSRILWLLISGLGLRAAGHPLVPYVRASPGAEFILAASTLSGVLELLGIGFYIVLMRRTIAGAPEQPQRQALQSIRPYMQSMLLGWPLYAIFNLILLATMAWRRQTIVDAWWNDIAIHCFISFVLLPVAFAFSVRFLPLYLRLAAPTWPVRRVAYIYLFGACLHVIALPLAMPALTQAGRIAKGVGILWFVWRLGIFTRGYLAWLGPASSRRPRALSRGGEGRYAFGAFEALIVSAYIWLTLAAACELLSGLRPWTGVSVNSDALRHLYLMGFVTLLIFGVAPRMLPGLMQARRIAHPWLVGATLWLGNAAVIGRVALIGLPGAMWPALPSWAVQAASIAFAYSGIWALFAVFGVALNIWRTADLASRQTAPASTPE